MRKVIIDKETGIALHRAYAYIKKDSLQNAEKVRKKILSSIKMLPKDPERHAPDKYRIDNDGSYRAYEVYKYRITYHVGISEIRIIRIRHTKMNPVEY
ncbi:type II toxin-antitoxin system RelE/ParE family toxin [Agriterribacter sp.]|uniref:type II toxin-antitoxin system RelE/ParE family toxin n=1 Tax=Agriterribacter sp. TaxID=2821509 RepID=UPI002C83AEB7|nr:type II toxin-antitoxin system RelE/ParE family toxin [Agriterribacter sp.]HRP54989.1 type II toxin-antitoxin system RelE/ParE family toxin [Agriterribacter sp.]